MATSADDQPKIELVGPTASHNPAAPTAIHPAPSSADEQPALGYPAVIGYPPGDPRCAYPYPYPAPPPLSNGMCPNPDTPYGQQQVEWRRLSRFSRGILLGIAFSVVSLITVTIIIQIALRPRMPNFLLSGFAVSNIGVSNDMVLMANWEVRVTVENRNDHIKLVLPMVQSFVYYRDPELSLLTMEVETPLVLGKKKSGVINLETMAVASNDTAAMKAVRNDLDGSKKVNFGLVMEVVMKFKYSWWWKKRETRNVYCEDIPVEFSSGRFAYYGSLAASDQPRKCLLLMN